MTEYRPHTDRVGPALVFGFGAAVTMWVAGFLSHIPGIALPPIAAGSALLFILLIATVWAGYASSLSTGILAGLLSSLITLLLLGAFLVEQPAPGAAPAQGAEGLRPAAAVTALGFLAAGALIGLVGGGLGRLLRTAPASSSPTPSLTHSPSDPWLARFAIVAALAFVPLLISGGFVTSAKAGMAVKGWPDSYGSNMFLFPISLMSNSRVYLEHTHRLMGSLVGLCSLALMVFTLLREKRRWVKIWAISVFAAVCLQGLLGGLRVNHNSLGIAIIHGILAQATFALAVALAVILHRVYFEAAASDPQAQDRKRRRFCTGILHALALQLILGATFRHLRHAGNPGAMHVLWTHVAWSVVVVIFSLAAGFLGRTRKGDRLADRFTRTAGGTVLGVVFFQFLLGWAALAFVMMSHDKTGVPLYTDLDNAPPIKPVEAIIRTTHQATGAFLLAAATALCVVARRISSGKRPAP